MNASTSISPLRGQPQPSSWAGWEQEGMKGLTSGGTGGDIGKVTDAAASTKHQCIFLEANRQSKC